ncbi:MAG TPA: metallophosphoesterase [Reyranella sp.]|jgi:3',5'-cyclic AMP phosphodiesterase CpdA
MAFRIAQISDTHLSESKPYFVENFVRIGEALRAAKPHLVVNTGDISLDGASEESDLAAGRLLHDALGLPLRFLPGNHDLGDAQETAKGEAPIDAGRRARYLKHFGPDWWWFDVRGWRVLGINALLLGSDLPEAAEQEVAAAQAMQGVGLRSLALFLHKPLFDQTAAESNISNRFLTPGQRGRLSAMLGTAPALIVSGHIHQYRSSDADGSHHVWGPSTAFVVPDRIQPIYGVKKVGYVEHTLKPDGTHDSRMIDVPGARTLNIDDLPRIY